MPNEKEHINLGDWLHIFQIVVLFISLGILYEKIDMSMQTTNAHTVKIDRIEHYLSSKDANYWKITKDDQ